MTLIVWLILKSIKTTSTDSCFDVSLRKLPAYSKAFSHGNIKCFCQHFTVKKAECIVEISFSNISLLTDTVYTRVLLALAHAERVHPL